MKHREAHDHVPVRRGRWLLYGFLIIVAFFLWREHRDHVLGALPLLLALACPLMHLFHHGHHRHGRDHRTPDERED